MQGECQDCILENSDPQINPVVSVFPSIPSPQRMQVYYSIQLNSLLLWFKLLKLVLSAVEDPSSVKCVKQYGGYHNNIMYLIAENLVLPKVGQEWTN